jgi:hypothetical protein
MFLFRASEIRSLAASHIHQTDHTCTCTLITRHTQHTYASKSTHMFTSTHAQTHTYHVRARVCTRVRTHTHTHTHTHTQNDYTECHIPDLSSCDFHVFGLQKKAVDGHHTMKCGDHSSTAVCAALEDR